MDRTRERNGAKKAKRQRKESGLKNTEGNEDNEGRILANVLCFDGLLCRCRKTAV
jgi:hypothetical protein